ncbi:MAG: PD-(D/E)XK nuclease family protein, partial [Alphaproteobacteria bacterium]
TTGTFAQCLDAFVEVAAELRRANPLQPVAALVGSHLVRRDLQRRLHRRLDGALGIWLLTFRELSERLGAPALHAAGRIPADPLYQRALIGRLLAERRTGSFAAVAGYEGAANTFLRTFEDLEEAGWPRWPAKASRRDKLGEVGELYNAYRVELTRAYATSQDLTAAAIEQTEKFPRLFGADALHVVGFYDANPQQVALLDALGKTIELRWYVPQVPNPPPLAARAGAEAPEPFSPDSENTLIWSCPSELMEARAIVREARRLRRGGIPYHRMGVLLRHFDVYAELLVDTCRRAGVPCCLEGGCPPDEATSLRGLGRLLQLLGSRLRRGEVMALLGAVNLPDGFSRADTQPRWDAVSRLARVRTADDWDRRLAAFAQHRKTSSADGEAADALRETVSELRVHLQAVEKARNYKSATAAFTRLARWLIAKDKWRDEALEKIERLHWLDRAGLPYSPAVFRARADALLREVREEVKDDDGLRIVDMVGARGLSFTAVFVPGCVESMIPQPPPQDPILLDDEREKICRDLGQPGALPVRADRAAEELRLFDIACRAAEQKLCFSFPRMDMSEGRARLPSHLLLQVASSLAGHAVTANELDRLPQVRVLAASRFAPADPADGIDDDERDLAWIETLAPARPTAPVYYLLAARPDSFVRVWRKWVHRWARGELGEYEGLCLSDPARDALAEALADVDAWPVTQLEDYVKCPRRYLLERLLKLDEPEDPEEIVSLAPNKRGSLIHDALEKALNPNREPQPLDELVGELYAKLAEENLTGGGVLDEVEVERIVDWVQQMAAFSAEQSAGYEVEDTEVDLGKKGAVIAVGDEQIKLRGRLDRVDRDASGNRRVIDYKSGKAVDPFTDKDLKPDSFNHGFTLQLPLYLLAYASLHAETVAEALSAAYWHLKKKGSKAEPTPVPISAGFYQARQEILREVLRDAVAGIRGGRFAPRPDVAGKHDNKYCGNCSFTVICDPRSRSMLSFKGRDEKHCPWLKHVGRIGEEEKE